MQFILFLFYGETNQQKRVSICGIVQDKRGIQLNTVLISS